MWCLSVTDKRQIKGLCKGSNWTFPMHVFSLWSAAWCDADDGALRCYQSIPHKLSWRGSSEGRHCLFVFTLGACCVPDGARDTQRERASGERERDRAHNATRVASTHNAHNAHSVLIRHHHQCSDVKGPSQLFNILVNRKLVCSLGLVVRVQKIRSQLAECENEKNETRLQRRSHHY